MIRVRWRIQDSPGRTTTYYSAKFSRKLHENEENLAVVEELRPKFVYVDPPLAGVTNLSNITGM